MKTTHKVMLGGAAGMLLAVQAIGRVLFKGMSAWVKASESGSSLHYWK